MNDLKIGNPDVEQVARIRDYAVWSLVAGIAVVMVCIGTAAAFFLPGRLGIPFYPIDRVKSILEILMLLDFAACGIAFWGVVFAINAYLDRNSRRTAAAAGISINGTGCFTLLLLIGLLGAAYT